MEKNEFLYQEFQDYTAIETYCSEAADVSIPEYVGEKPVKIILPGAFKNNLHIKTISFPSSLEEIGENAFSGCINLKNVHFNKSLKKICSSAFYGCKSLSSLKLPEDLYFIGNRAFCGCSGINEIHVPKHVEAVPDWAFYGCESAVNVILDRGVKEIGEHAFNGCTSLKSIFLPDTMEKIGDFAFGFCESIFVDGNNVFFTEKDGVLFDKSGESLLFFPPNFDAVDYTVPDGVKAIGKNAFYGCKNITRIILSDGLETIEGYAFYFCKNLDEVHLPASLKSIGEYAFQSCERLQEVTIPAAVKAIGKSSFASCKLMENLLLPEGLEEIGDNAFSECISLKSVSYPKTLKRIGAGAFYICKSMEDCVLPEGLEEIGENAFGQCSSLIHVSLPLSIKNVKDSAFVVDRYYINNLKKVVLRDGMREHVVIIPNAPADIRKLYLKSVSGFFNGRSGFEAYDKLFSALYNDDEKVPVAFSRVKDGLFIEGIYYDQYIGFLNTNVDKIAENIIKTDNVGDMEVLSKLRIINAENIDRLIRKAFDMHRIEMQAWLMDYKNERIGTKGISFVL
ncbi:MAG: leucine-rich repeat domain-containing protein [Clostridiaceae bacterium]